MSPSSCSKSSRGSRNFLDAVAFVSDHFRDILRRRLSELAGLTLITLALLAGIALVTAVAVGWPLIRGRSGPVAPAAAESEVEARALRHRVALDALLDVEADRRAGSLDDASYVRERADAEARAAQTLTEPLDEKASPEPAAGSEGRRARIRRPAGAPRA